ncbi:MAG: sn-glycerol-3-phosphate ABC transporter ATP-binding protein UgpC [Alphaproteobacteria bacterium]|nr:sn-glycerol-3-phosphate ABC transporter ATP-binding protein UgpC [Alphaproteobacteria bacterium]
MASIELRQVSKIYPGSTAGVKDIDLKIEDGEFVIFLGPSGCGKSTLLRSIAGLESITAGDVLINGEVVNHVAPRDRNIAVVFQSYALYPHMNVWQNMAFGLRMRGAPADEIDTKVKEAAELLGLTSLMQRKPSALSGGQRQRVALGRAIVRDPQAFLLDEPLSNLDAQLRAEMRLELVRLHRKLGRTTVHVTHDQVEAMTMGDRIFIMKDGHLIQQGPPLEVYANPADTFVAGFLASPPMNLVPGRLVADGDGLSFVTDGLSLPIPAAYHDAYAAWSGKPVTFGLRSEDFHASPTGDASAPVALRVEAVEALGPENIVIGRVAASERPVAARLSRHYSAQAGDTVTLHADLMPMHLFSPEDGKAIARPRTAASQLRRHA